MSTAIHSVHDCLARINRDIERCERPRERVMLEIYRDHWWAEVLNNVDAIMATLPADKVSYLFDGFGLFFPEAVVFTEPSRARSLYQGAANLGLPMAGTFAEERWAFADWGMSFEGVLSNIVYGSSLPRVDDVVDPKGLYLVSWRTACIHPMDVQRRLMLGEHVYTGSVVRMEPADRSTLERMYGSVLV
jgi:hypothetical protein